MADAILQAAKDCSDRDPLVRAEALGFLKSREAESWLEMLGYRDPAAGIAALLRQRRRTRD